MQPTKATVFSFLRKHESGVLATVDSQGRPCTTPIHYVVSTDKSIRFVTGKMTSKFQNLLNNPHVSLSIIDDVKPIAVNILGKTKIIEDYDKAHATYLMIGNTHNRSNPPPVTKHNRGDFVVIEISPLHIQYTDYSLDRDKKGQYIFDL